jgi:hypothetical protein
MLTYGEQLLAQASEIRRRAALRRRRLLLLCPLIALTCWSLADLVAARGARLHALHAGGFRIMIDHAEPIIWTVLFVMVPIAYAVKPNPLPSGAGLAFIAGPVMTPFLFGAGGWRPWQIALLVLFTILILGGARERRRGRHEELIDITD